MTFVQEICIFSKLKFVFSNMRFIFNNLRFAFNEMKFMKLEPFTSSKPDLEVTKYTIKKFRRNERSCLLVVHPVCKYFSRTFRMLFAHYRDDF